MNLLSMLGNMGNLTSKAPQIANSALASILEQYRGDLVPENGEAQIIFISHPKGGDKKEFILSVVALSADDKILRIIASMTLTEALQIMLKNLPNA